MKEREALICHEVFSLHTRLFSMFSRRVWWRSFHNQPECDEILNLAPDGIDLGLNPTGEFSHVKLFVGVLNEQVE